jgi:pyridoxamine 5'-phosphate oxidase-like protein
MGKQYKSLSKSDVAFIQAQKLFYIASASSHEVNLSPKGYDSIHVFDPNTLYMLDYLGSGNRTARDIDEGGEVTLLFNAFEDAPKILRCFCKAEVIEKEEDTFGSVSALFDEDVSAIRQIFRFRIYAVESSCGMGVPLMHYQKERSGVRDYALKMAKNDMFDQYADDHKNPPDLHDL